MLFLPYRIHPLLDSLTPSRRKAINYSSKLEPIKTSIHHNIAYKALSSAFADP
jgi:hypothetical protein